MNKPLINAAGTGTGGPPFLTAFIYPEGAETTYEFKIECRLREASNECEGGEPSVGGGPFSGTIAAGYGGKVVNAGVTGLKPGEYWWRITATNSAGSAEWDKQGLVIPEVKSNEQAANESGNLAAERTVQEVHEQQAREAAAKKAAEETAEAKAAEEAELRRRQEEQAAEQAAHVQEVVCVVPNLRGDTMSAARRALARAHCRLGQVRGRQRGRTRLVVAAQSIKSGTARPTGTPVAVTLNVRRPR